MEHTWQLAARLVARLVPLPEQLRRQPPTPLPAAALLATSRAPLAVACPHACACCVLGGRCGGRSLQVQWQEASSQLGPMAGISHLTGAKAQVVQGMRQLSAAGPASQPCFPCLPLPSPWSSSPSPTDTKGKQSPCLRASVPRASVPAYLRACVPGCLRASVYGRGRGRGEKQRGAHGKGGSAQGRSCGRGRWQLEAALGAWRGKACFAREGPGAVWPMCEVASECGSRTDGVYWAVAGGAGGGVEDSGVAGPAADSPECGHQAPAPPRLAPGAGTRGP